MIRLTLFLLWVCAVVTISIAAPVPLGATTQLEKRRTGRGTWFRVGKGACGQVNENNDHIVALSEGMYASADVSAHCGQYVHVTNSGNGKSVYAMVRDECPSCGDGDLDMSPGAFSAIGNLDQGVLKIDWSFMDKGWNP